jgi:two-component system chemotaxis response regulator CheY
MKILIVDDSRVMRNIMKQVLEGPGSMDIWEADGGEMALSCLAASRGFDLAVIDWNMPKMDGLTLARRIREADRALPLVLVTTEGERGRMGEAMKAGVNEILVKPFTPGMLMEKVRAVVGPARVAA